jgi:hypothetical protein
MGSGHYENKGQECKWVKISRSLGGLVGDRLAVIRFPTTSSTKTWRFGKKCVSNSENLHCHTQIRTALEDVPSIISRDPVDKGFSVKIVRFISELMMQPFSG